MDDVTIGDRRWTRQEDKQFENGIVEFPEDCPDRWERIAARLGTRSAAEVEWHYAVLLADIEAIEAGLIEPPEYTEMNQNLEAIEAGLIEPPKYTEMKQTEVRRKSGQPWTEEEHGLFLEGLEKCGKGDWKSISREYVLTRNTTQIASHAQKYYARQEMEEGQRKRRSIFDKPIVTGN
ncbi:transcription factor divaricata [Phtheirospermum japonicum]|uniref:Transcription factor divaricata n=1 Tax=Phtheirospermum japonicum TaxID=374723 RepID=A0A830CEK6_9LAMI|nr:transcription factor divaricata [Phtheirospermum japonicum]